MYVGSEYEDVISYGTFTSLTHTDRFVGVRVEKERGGWRQTACRGAGLQTIYTFAGGLDLVVLCQRAPLAQFHSG